MEHGASPCPQRPPDAPGHREAPLCTSPLPHFQYPAYPTPPGHACSAYLTRLGTLKHRAYVAGDWTLTLLFGRDISRW